MAAATSQTIFSWIWRHQSRLALVPVVVVECLLIAVYLASNAFSTQANLDALRATAEGELDRAAQAQAGLIHQQLLSVRRETQQFQRATLRSLRAPLPEGGLALDNLVLNESTGAWYSPEDQGGAARHLGNLHTLDDPLQAKIRRLEHLDPLLKDVVETHPLVVQMYINTSDSLTQIYPWFLADGQFAPDMDVTTFNFYYEAGPTATTRSIRNRSSTRTASPRCSRAMSIPTRRSFPTDRCDGSGWTCSSAAAVGVPKSAR